MNNRIILITLALLSTLFLRAEEPGKAPLTEYEVQQKVHSLAKFQAQYRQYTEDLNKLGEELGSTEYKLKVAKEKNLSTKEKLQKEYDELKAKMDALSAKIEKAEAGIKQNIQFITNDLSEAPYVELEEDSALSLTWMQDKCAQLDRRYEEQQQAIKDAQQQVADAKAEVRAAQSLQAEAERKAGILSKFVLYYGNTLLYQKYVTRVDDVLEMLDYVPDEIKKADVSKDIVLKLVERFGKEQKLSSFEVAKLTAHQFSETTDDEEFQARNKLLDLIWDIPQQKLEELSYANVALNVLKAVPDSLQGQSKYRKVTNLLKLYGPANAELKNIVKDALESDDLTYAAYAARRTALLNKVQSTSYYKDYYSKRNSGVWQIVYLSERYEEVIGILNDTSMPVEQVRERFEDLLKRL